MLPFGKSFIALVLLTIPSHAQSSGRIDRQVASKLIGSPVLAADGETMGQVSDVATDENGRPVAIRVSVGARLGFGAHIVELPASAFSIKDGRVVLDMPAEVVGGHLLVEREVRHDPLQTTVLFGSDAFSGMPALSMWAFIGLRAGRVGATHGWARPISTRLWAAQRDEQTIGDVGDHVEDAIRKKSNALTQETEERRRLFETSLDLILITDRQGNLIRVSPGSVSTLGYSPEEMIGRSVGDFVFPDDLEATRTEMRLARAGQHTRNFETRYVHKDGRNVTLAWSGVWSEPEQRYFFVGRDMTERKAAEEQLRQLAHYDQLTGLANRKSHAAPARTATTLAPPIQRRNESCVGIAPSPCFALVSRPLP
jgi:PAS domain S-box-containing protein